MIDDVELTLNPATATGNDDELGTKAMKEVTVADLQLAADIPHLSIRIPLEGAPMLFIEGRKHEHDTERLFEWLHEQPLLMELIRQAQAIRDDASRQ